MIREVETEIDYGNLSPEAAALVKKDSAGVPLLMTQLLSGFPSIRSAGRRVSLSLQGESFLRRSFRNLLPTSK